LLTKLNAAILDKRRFDDLTIRGMLVAFSGQH
jgi:hypothetical protein